MSQDAKEREEREGKEEASAWPPALQGWASVEQIFSSVDGEGVFRHLRHTGWLDLLCPLPVESVGWDLDQSSSPYHFETVWAHTLSVVRHLDAVLEEYPASPSQRLCLRLVALYHDAGKTIPQKGHQYKEDGRIRFIGHQLLSTEIAREALQRLEAPPEIAEAVIALVYSHDEILHLKESHFATIDPSPALLRLVEQLQLSKDSFLNLCLFAMADRRAHAPGYDDDALARMLYQNALERHDAWVKRLLPFFSHEQIAAILSLDPHSPPVALVAAHLHWTQLYGYLREAEEAALHLQRLVAITEIAQAERNQTLWWEIILAALESLWPPLTLSPAIWIIDHHHQLRYPAKEKAETAQPIFPWLLHGRDLLDVAEEIAPLMQPATTPPKGRWIKEALRQIGLWQIEHACRDPLLARQQAKHYLQTRWEDFF